VTLRHRHRHRRQRLMRPIDHVARAMIGGKEIEPHGAEIHVEIVIGHRSGRQDAVEGQVRHFLEDRDVLG
jgi:hypothetical protein